MVRRNKTSEQELGALSTLLEREAALERVIQEAESRAAKRLEEARADIDRWMEQERSAMEGARRGIEARVLHDSKIRIEGLVQRARSADSRMRLSPQDRKEILDAVARSVLGDPA